MGFRLCFMISSQGYCESIYSPLPSVTGGMGPMQQTRTPVMSPKLPLMTATTRQGVSRMEGGDGGAGKACHLLNSGYSIPS